MDLNGFYSNTVAIVQSSGTGKSRLVDELAKLIFTIPINIRNPQQHNGTRWRVLYFGSAMLLTLKIVAAYPYSDVDIFNLWTSNRAHDSLQAESMFYQFFENLFKGILRQLEVLYPRRTPAQKNISEDWRSFLESKTERNGNETITQRQKFYYEASVGARCSILLFQL